MKIKTTKKSIRESGNPVYKIGYCNAQWLLKYQEPFAYSTGAEGWACDYYLVGNVIISTGYAPIGKAVDYEMLREYDDKARKIACGSMSWAQAREAVETLLNEFVENLN